MPYRNGRRIRNVAFCMVNRDMNCRSRPYGWNTRRVARSPFRNMKTAKNKLRLARKGKSIGFTARSSLKSMGIMPRSSGCYELGKKYK